jgi:indole-3-glycerol phosphate synthase
MLNKIVKTKQQEVLSLHLSEEAVNVANFSLYNAIGNENTDIAVIAEVKKASPSKGIIREDFNPVEIAKGYEKGGATAVSVLTDQTYFKGHNTFLTDIKKEINLPVLRKDFIINEKQITESRLIGADAILLIAAILSPSMLYEYYQNAHEQGLEVLVEVHDEWELESVLKKFTPRLIGVNNRDLKTFATSLEITKRLSPMIPPSSFFVSESGIFTREDLNYVINHGADAVLVGESLMKAKTPEAGLRALLGERE